MKNWTFCIIASIICRLLGLVAVLAFVYSMVVFTESLSCLWLLFLILILDYIPAYEIKEDSEKTKDKKETINGN
jgi:hypothetical protein